uniref:Uncharacterized protein n=1 Tax=Avena sativa TaxID=4498 RepID=A0ACD5Z5G1_AVESA
MDFAINATQWAVGKALAPVTDGLLESWAASTELGHNMDALKMELLYVHGMLDNAQGRDVRSVALKELLHKLRNLAYKADDALDEVEYFRIQDALDGTYHAADVHAKGCLCNLALNAGHVAKGMANKLKPTSCSSANSRGMLEHSDMPGRCGGRFLCGAWPLGSNAPHRSNRDIQLPKLKFDRVEMSTRIVEIIEQLKPVCAKVSTILNLELLGSSRTTSQEIATNRPKTTPEIIEPKLYGRDEQKNNIVNRIAHGKYSANELTVLPIVGPGGIGKTTFTQHIYDEVKSRFQVPIWICVSLNFSASSLAQEMLKKIPEVDGENKNASDGERIEQRLKSKSFLLVLDDVWTHPDDEWQKLLAPFKKAGSKGNVVIVTTRIPAVAKMVGTKDCLEQLGSLDFRSSMSFFEACVFGNEIPWKNHPDFFDIGKQIVPHLKGSPLAIKTVGRLLRNKLTLEHWNRVLESKEWELKTSDNDIMPALRLSYDHLPFHLQKCFSYCGLFPEDYEFDSKELVRLWIGLGILHSCDPNTRIEDVGLCYLDELVNHGFFTKSEKEDGSTRYVIHDLLHNLAVKVSSQECLSIHSSNVRSIQIPRSVRHLSIFVDDKDVKDRMTFLDYSRDLRALDKILNVESLHTLMLFGQYHGSFAKTFGDLFSEAKAFRTILLYEAPCSVKDILRIFSKTIHLRYLRIRTVDYKSTDVPSMLSRLYHLEVIDLGEWRGPLDTIRDMSNLVKLRYFVVRNDELHSKISEVGKLKLLLELRSFEVGKRSAGFELSQLDELTELGGSLRICNLERGQEKEINGTKPIHRNHLQRLSLEWAAKRSDKNPTREDNVLDCLLPQSNLTHLRIRGHGGTSCPTWLGSDLFLKKLESLSLDNVSWKTFPPLGELWLVDDLGIEWQGCVASQGFHNLKRLELVKIPKLTKWVGTKSCQLFCHLEGLIIEDCPELMELQFSCSTCYQPEQGVGKMIWLPRLRNLSIEDCPKLTSMPPVPWTRALRSIFIARTGLRFKKLRYSESIYRGRGFDLVISGVGGIDSLFWNELDFCNMSVLTFMSIDNCPPLSLDRIQMLTSLTTLDIRGGSNVLVSPTRGESNNGTYKCPIEQVGIQKSCASGKELTQLLSRCTRLIHLAILNYEKVIELGVVEQETREGVEIAAAEGRLLLPTQLQSLYVYDCPELSIAPTPSSGSGGNNNNAATGILQRLYSLRMADIRSCPKFLSSYACFPTSLEKLRNLGGMETLEILSNLTSLTELMISNCGDVRGEGVWPLLTAQGQLTQLSITDTPKFFFVDPPPQELHSSKLQSLNIQGPAAVLSVPTCRLLSSSLTSLTFDGSKEVEPISDEALQLLTSLQELQFSHCDNLQFLPATLHTLSRLEKLAIYFCHAIKSLPKGGLPRSLHKLTIFACHAIKSLPKDCFPSSLQELEISQCPDIKSRPMDSLPSSLRVLDVSSWNNKELTRRCRKLTGTIPIIRA